MSKWPYPPINEELKEKSINKEKKSEEPRIVQLGLMNGEIIKIHIEDIDCLQVFGVSENHYITKDYPYLEVCKFCAKAYIKLSKEVCNKKYTLHSGLTIYERLTQRNDLSDITYLNQSGHFIDRILVPWSDMSFDGIENGHQFSRMDKQGNLEIIIKGD